MTRKKGKMVEIRLFVPKSVAKHIDRYVKDGELGRTRSAVIRSLLVGWKRGEDKGTVGGLKRRMGWGGLSEA